MLRAMASLVPCPACARHVRANESSCPFCATAIGAVPERVLSPAPSDRLLARVAVTFAAAAATALTACGKEPTDKPVPAPTNTMNTDNLPAPAYGPPPVMPEAAAPDFAPAPNGALIATTAKLPPPLQRFASRASAGVAMTPKVQIVFPPNGASLELSGVAGESPDPIAIKIAGGTPPLNVLLNGMPLAGKKSARTLFFAPDGPGFVRLTVTDATGAANSVMVRLQ